MEHLFEPILIGLSLLLGTYLGYKLVLWLIDTKLLFKFAGIVMMIVGALTGYLNYLFPPNNNPAAFFYVLGGLVTLLGIFMLWFDQNKEWIIERRNRLDAQKAQEKKYKDEKRQ
jgi:amino acid permease